MGLFDDISGTFNKVANTTIKKSKDLTELTKLSLKLSSEEGDLAKLYENLGKIVYEAAKNKETPKTNEVFSQIDIRIASIQDINENIEQLKGVIICPKCGTKNKETDTFCSSCGEKLPKHENTDEGTQDNTDKQE